MNKSMTPENFCYWLQGFFELHDKGRFEVIDAERARIIRDHLREVFIKVTPERGGAPSAFPVPHIGDDIFC